MYNVLRRCTSSHRKAPRLKRMITPTFIGTPDSAPLGPPLPCRPFNKNVRDVVGTIGTTRRRRRRLRYQAYYITCPSTTSALFCFLSSSEDVASGQRLAIVWPCSLPAALHNNKHDVAFMTELSSTLPNTASLCNCFGSSRKIILTHSEADCELDFHFFVSI